MVTGVMFMRKGFVFLVVSCMLAGTGLAQQSAGRPPLPPAQSGSGVAAEAAAPVFSPGQEQEIAAAARMGGAATLATGEFIFDTAWFLSADLELTGAGMDETIVTFTAPAEPDGSALMWDGAGTLMLRDLTIRLSSAEAGNVIEAQSGSLVLENAVVRGAVSRMSEEGSSLMIQVVHAGNGVAVYGDAVADFMGVMLMDNDASGLLAGGSSHGQLAYSRVADNGHNGVTVQGESAGEYARNLVEDNGENGIVCLDAATATVTGNRMGGNGAYGYVRVHPASCGEADSIFAENALGDTFVRIDLSDD